MALRAFQWSEAADNSVYFLRNLFTFAEKGCYFCKKNSLPVGQGVGALLSGEVIFTNSTKRTFKIFGNFFPGRASRNTSLRYTYGGIIHPTAYIAYVLLHVQ